MTKATDHDNERKRRIKNNVRRTSNLRVILAKKIPKLTKSNQPSNGDLVKYSPSSSLVRSQSGLAPYRGSFTKFFTHDANGFVLYDKFETLLKAINEDSKHHWNDVEVNNKLVDPQAFNAFTPLGYAAQSIPTHSPAPALASAEAGTELIELYCMSGCRDIPFDTYSTLPVEIVSSLSAMNTSNVISAYEGITDQITHLLTHDLIFKGSSAGDIVGPHISQFLLLPVPMQNTMFIVDQLYPPADSQTFLTNFTDYLNNQNDGTNDPSGPITFGATKRYVATGRDLANVVHWDNNLTHPMNAALILWFGLKCPLDSHIPYTSITNQTGFVYFGILDLLTSIAEATHLSMAAAWNVKWNINLRPRPEEMAAHLHTYKTNPLYSFLSGSLPSNLPSNTSITDFAFTPYSTYLLSQAFSEGAPAHPAYPSGHATFMGAAVTILKAWFKNSQAISSLTTYGGVTALPVEADSGTSYTTLTQYTGPNNLTVASELDKLASNVANGRLWGGIHYRSDGDEGILLGERVAIQFLTQRAKMYPASLNFKGFRLTKRNGEVVTIK
jgi:membrane-associated phospholipid phosphatase